MSSADERLFDIDGIPLTPVEPAPTPSAPPVPRRKPKHYEPRLVEAVEDPDDIRSWGGGDAQPVLKWVGGKRQMLTALRSRVRFGEDGKPACRRYFEPFFGGGALFFNLAPNQAVISDTNKELIDLYSTLVVHVDKVIARLQQMENTEEAYYAEREKNPEALTAVDRAARTIYLNRTCFNGVYRVNKQGKFNVPWGKNPSATICDPPTLYKASEALSRAAIKHGGYLEVLDECGAGEGDLVFLDPPYLPYSNTADFTAYTAEGFSVEDTERLAAKAIELYEKGCDVIITNSSCDDVKRIFDRKPFHYRVEDTRRNVSSNGAARTGFDVIATAVHGWNHDTLTFD